MEAEDGLRTSKMEEESNSPLMNADRMQRLATLEAEGYPQREANAGFIPPNIRMVEWSGD